MCKYGASFVYSRTLSQPGLPREGRHNVNSKFVFSGNRKWAKSACAVYQTINRMSPQVGVFVLIFLAFQIPQLYKLSWLSSFYCWVLKWWIAQLCHPCQEWKWFEINVSGVFTSLWIITFMPLACHRCCCCWKRAGKNCMSVLRSNPVLTALLTYTDTHVQ